MNKDIKKPNFFIIGAPKCGTTSMSEYLRGHPDVFFSDPKEPHYFNTDFSDDQRKVHSREGYLNLFKDAAGSKAIGEGSVWYLYSKEAVMNILDFNPDAKFVVMVRNPLDLFYSLYYQYRYSLIEDCRDPAEAWNLQDKRLSGNNLPQKCLDPKLLQYRNICSLGYQLENLYKLVSKDKVQVVFMQDIKENESKVCQEVCSFLGISTHELVFPSKNKRKKNKSYVIKKILRLISFFKKKFRIKKDFGIHSRIKEINSEEVLDKKRNNHVDLEMKLKTYFKSDVGKLSRLTGRDLSHWI